MYITPSRRRRALVLGVAPAVVLTLALTACGRGSEPDTATATATATSVDDEPATGTLDFWAGSPDGDALPDFLAEFEEDNPDVELNIRTIPSDEFDTTLTTAIASGTVPDMVFLYSQTQSTMLSTEAFAPVPEDLVDPSSFFSSSYDTTLVDGVSHAVPWYTYANVVYYRKDLVEEVGAELPTTWSERLEFAQTMKDAGYATPLAQDVGWDGYTGQALNDFVHQNGGSLLSEDGTEWTLNAPENVEALEYYASAFADGYATPDGPTFLDTTPWFSSGQTIALVNGPWFPGFLDGANGDGWSAENVGAFVPPAGPTGDVATSLGGGSLAVLEDADNADAAWKLVRYMSQPEVQVDWYETFGNLPAVEAAWDEDVIAHDPLLAAVKEALPAAIPVPQVPGWGEVGMLLGQQAERVARGQVSAQEALDEAQAQAESIGTGVE